MEYCNRCSQTTVCGSDQKCTFSEPTLAISNALFRWPTTIFRRPLSPSRVESRERSSSSTPSSPSSATGPPTRSTRPTKTLPRRPQQHRNGLANGGGGATEGAAVVCGTRPVGATPRADGTGHINTNMLLPRSLPCARSNSTKNDGGRARKNHGANANASNNNRDGPQDGSGAKVEKPTGRAKSDKRSGEAKRGRNVAAPQQGDGGGRISNASTGKARRKVQGWKGDHANVSTGAGRKKKLMRSAAGRANTAPATTKVTLPGREGRVQSESEDREAKKHVKSAKSKLTMKIATSCWERRQFEYERDEESSRQPRIASSTLKATTSGRKRQIIESDDEQEQAVHATTVNKVARMGRDKSVCDRWNVQGWQRRDGTPTIPMARVNNESP